MPLDKTFSEAWLHDLPRNYTPSDPWSNHRVLGRRLRPFSLWHRLLLRSIDSPFLDATRTATPQDLDRLASICRCRYLQVDFNARGTARLFWQISAGGLDRNTDALAKYMEDFGARPDYREAPTNAPDKSAPELPIGRPELEFTQACAIVKWSRWPEAMVWEMPECMSEWYYTMAMEADGARFDFTNDERREYEANLDAIFERRRKKAEALTKEMEAANGNRK